MSDMKCSSDRLSEAEMGRIALKLVIRQMAKQKEIPDASYRQREIPNIAKEIGEDAEKLREFARCITPPVIGRIVGCRHVSLSDWDDTHGRQQS